MTVFLKPVGVETNTVVSYDDRKTISGWLNIDVDVVRSAVNEGVY